jgi:hypothetical protein
MCCAAPLRPQEPKKDLPPVTREHARANERWHAVCDAHSKDQSAGETPSVLRAPLALDRRGGAASSVVRQEPTPEAICEVALLSCLETETVKARTLWTWDDGARLELSLGGRSKIGAVYRTTW